MDTTHHLGSQAGQVLVITTPAKDIRTNVIVLGIMTISAAFFLIYIAHKDDSISQSDLITIGWMMSLIIGSLALATILPISTWKLDERGILWMPRFRKPRYLAWDEIDRVSRLGGELYSSKSKTTVRFIGISGTDGKKVLAFVERHLGDRFNFEPTHRPVKVFSHPAWIIITVLLIVLWYGIVLKQFLRLPWVETLTKAWILALVLAPALPLIPFYVRALIKAEREHHLLRK